MNRLTFLKRLLGGVAAAPVLAKALTEEKVPLPLPMLIQHYQLSATTYPVMTGTRLIGLSGNYGDMSKNEIKVSSVKRKRKGKRK